MSPKKSPKISFKYFCNLCDYKCNKPSEFNKHLSTDKHKKRENASKMLVDASQIISKNIFTCKCGKIYNHDSSYYRHKKKCNIEIEISNKIICPNENYDNDIIKFLMKENNDFKMLLIEQNKQILDLANKSNCNTFNTNTNNIHTNSHNKTFNLNMFLNETCKNAMNISDFVNSIQLQLSDLEDVGELGYVNGISNIIIKNLKELDVTQRPIHCTDSKREILYVKDKDKWEKENDNRDKIVGFVKNVANKNIKMLNEFKNKYPDCVKRESRYSDHYNKLVIEAMGGSDNNSYDEKHDKIIKKISKEVTIDKELL